jgi:hypothetical protein
LEDDLSTADAAPREADWLNAYGDTLPALAATQGGPFSIIQAYDPRTIQARKTGIYVTRPAFKIDRFANIRQMPHYTFHVKLVWPFSTTSGAEEVDQANFDAAIDLVLQRILGLQEDKTHGGRFLAVAEAPEFVTFTQDDPVTTFPNRAGFLGTFIYYADDFEYIG